jgi:hypothetical protein
MDLKSRNTTKVSVHAWSHKIYEHNKGLFGMAPEPNSTSELSGASQTLQLQKMLEQPNSMEFLEL